MMTIREFCQYIGYTRDRKWEDDDEYYQYKYKASTILIVSKDIEVIEVLKQRLLQEIIVQNKMETVVVNDVKVHPYKGSDDRPYKYQDVFSHPYENILIVGPKNTGKSMLSGSIILKCISNRSVFRIFSTTMEADNTTQKTISKLKKRDIDVEQYESLQPGELKSQEDQIKNYILENKEKLEKFKYRFPLCIYLWDDFRENFKAHPEISNLFTKNRHYRILNIVSTQRYKDIQTCARMNTQILILTKGLSKIVLKQIYEEQEIHLPFEKFYEIYEFCTDDKYNFMFCDFDKNKYRKNFDEEIVL